MNETHQFYSLHHYIQSLGPLCGARILSEDFWAKATIFLPQSLQKESQLHRADLQSAYSGANIELTF